MKQPIIITTDHKGDPVVFNILESLLFIEDGRVYLRTHSVNIVLRISKGAGLGIEDDIKSLRDYIAGLHRNYLIG